MTLIAFGILLVLIMNTVMNVRLNNRTHNYFVLRDDVMGENKRLKTRVELLEIQLQEAQYELEDARAQ